MFGFFATSCSCGLGVGIGGCTDVGCFRGIYIGATDNIYTRIWGRGYGSTIYYA